MFKQNEKEICPLMGKKCIEERCKFWTHLLGMDPQTGHPIDSYDCSIKWLPVLLVENSNFMRQNKAAVEDTRNEIVKRYDEFNQLVYDSITRSKQLKGE